MRVRGSISVGVLSFACGQSDPIQPPPPPGNLDVTIGLELVVDGLSAAVDLTAPPSDDRLFVAEQAGRIRIIQDGQLLQTPFLDISNQVNCCGEEGLLGIAFHPDYENNGYVYVSYTHDNGNSRIDRYTVSAEPNVADGGTALTIFSLPQPFSNHNGGQVAFGPDGMLYVGLGDGGGGNDPLGSGQDTQTPLGSLLRLDVDGGSPYRIPPDNPFAGSATAAQEIWAYGLRNPWRFSFDAVEGTIYVGDVGQGAWEEVNAAPVNVPGLNYGWNIMEGAHCRPGGATNCNTTGLELPAVEFQNNANNCAVVGGFVYRGTVIAEIIGHYFYSDYCGGWLRSFRYENGTVTDETSWNVGSFGRPRSFGRDANNELYIVAESQVWRFVRAEPGG